MQGDFFLTTWVLQGMRWLNANVTGGHIVLTIIISTILVRLISLFGDIKSRKSNMKMQAIQPEIQRLQKKYKDNPQKMQMAQRKLMKDRGVSMFGGCLPMLIMMPLIFCFIAAFRFWGYEQMVRALLELNETGSSELFSSFKFLWVNNIWQADNGTLPVVMEATQFLKIPELSKLLYFQENPAAFETFKNLGLLVSDPKNIPQSAIDTYNRLIAPIAAQYQGYSNGWFILPILAGGTTFLSSKIMQKGQPKPAQGAADTAQSMNKTMTYLMPAMSVFFCLTSNAAFAVYWTISNVVSSISNYFVNKALMPKEVSTEVQEK